MVWPILSKRGRKNRVENEKNGICVTVYSSRTMIATDKRISNSERRENFKDLSSKMVFREINVFRVKNQVKKWPKLNNWKIAKSAVYGHW